MIATAIASGLALTTISAQMPGRNVNMLSGTTWPDGDPFRTVDVPGLGIEEHGDAWLCLDKSSDGGQRWTSTLLPGYPQDPTLRAHGEADDESIMSP